jgi:hypothetical protein
MDLSHTLVGLAAVLGGIAWNRGSLRGERRLERGALAGASPDGAQEIEACPGCGADAVTFGYEEEVDARFQGIEIVRCPGCGWKQVLPPA